MLSAIGTVWLFMGALFAFGVLVSVDMRLDDHKALAAATAAAVLAPLTLLALTGYGVAVVVGEVRRLRRERERERLERLEREYEQITSELEGD